MAKILLLFRDDLNFLAPSKNKFELSIFAPFSISQIKPIFKFHFSLIVLTLVVIGQQLLNAIELNQVTEELSLKTG